MKQGKYELKECSYLQTFTKQPCNFQSIFLSSSSIQNPLSPNSFQQTGFHHSLGSGRTIWRTSRSCKILIEIDIIPLWGREKRRPGRQGGECVRWESGWRLRAWRRVFTMWRHFRSKVEPCGYNSCSPPPPPPLWTLQIFLQHRELKDINLDVKLFTEKNVAFECVFIWCF